MRSHAIQEMAAVKRLWYTVRSPLNARFHADKRQSPAYRRWIEEHQRERKTSDSQFYNSNPCYWSLVSCYWL